VNKARRMREAEQRIHVKDENYKSKILKEIHILGDNGVMGG
jgi:hypothetical protein